MKMALLAALALPPAASFAADASSQAKAAADAAWSSIAPSAAAQDQGLLESMRGTASKSRRPAEAPPDEISDAGLVLDESPGGLPVLRVWPGSLAESLGIQPGDRIFSINGRSAATAREARKALSEPVFRLGAAVLREGRVLGLASAGRPSAKDPARGEGKLNAREERLKGAFLKEAEGGVPGALKSLKTPAFTLRAGETLWVRFPKGILRSVAEGDSLEAETAAPLAMDPSLDFIAVPAGSRVFFCVLRSGETDGARTLLLHAYKIRLAGGSTAPCSAVLARTPEGRDWVQVGSSGTLASAPAALDRFLAPPERSFEMRLLKPMTLHEPAGFFQAGPGLWIKSGLKSFEISRVVPRRPAAQAGLKPGDRVISIGGKTAGKMSFEEAVSRLYGKPGSKVELRVLRAGEAQGESLSLERGALARFEPGVEALREGRSVRVARVLSGSPAERAGIREGDALLSLGKDEAASLGDEELKERLLSDLTGENAPVFQSSGKPPRQVPLERGEFTTPLEPRIFEGN